MVPALNTMPTTAYFDFQRYTRNNVKRKIPIANMFVIPAFSKLIVVAAMRPTTPAAR